MKEIVAAFRSVVRPIVTLALVGAVIAFVAMQIPIPPEFWAMAAGVVAWWFYSRQKKA